jgi:hypothetical protein
MLRAIVLGDTKVLLALKRYRLGDNIYSLQGKVIENSTQTSIRIGRNKHIEDVNGAFMNHSCLANTIVLNGNIIATRHIAPGNELTFNYITHEDKLNSPFLCFKCNTYIDGADKTVCPVYKKNS